MAHHIKDSLASLLVKEVTWHTVISQQWHTIMGDLSNRMCVEKIQKNTLIIGVYDAGWLQELYYLSDMIKQKINDYLQAPHVHEIKFKATLRRKQMSSPVYEKKQFSLKKHPLSPLEQSALNRIEDTNLRSLLHEFLLRSYEEKK